MKYAFQWIREQDPNAYVQMGDPRYSMPAWKDAAAYIRDTLDYCKQFGLSWILNTANSIYNEGGNLGYYGAKTGEKDGYIVNLDYLELLQSYLGEK